MLSGSVTIELPLRADPARPRWETTHIASVVLDKNRGLVGKSIVAIAEEQGKSPFDAFFDLCALYQDVYLDTAMVFNRFLGGPPPIQRVLEFQDRVVFGSDFPNIPYRLESAIQSILDLRLGRGLEEKLLCTNAARLLGLDLVALTRPE